MLCMAARTMTIVSGIIRQTCTTVTAMIALVRSLNQTWFSKGSPERREDAVQQSGAGLIDPQPDDGIDDARKRPGQDDCRKHPLPPDLELVDQRGREHAEDGFRKHGQYDVNEGV
jgi:hypothetical protein